VKGPSALVFPLLALLAVPLPAQAAGIAVSGRVLTPDGQGAPGVRVLLVPELPSFAASALELAGKAGPEPAASAATDAAGTFRLTAPETGMWTVRLMAAGFMPMETGLLPLTEETDLPDARLVPDAGLRVQVADPRGKPVAGGWVRVESAGGPSSPTSPWVFLLRRIAFTDAGGGVTVPRGADEAPTVWAAAAGFLPARQEKVRGGAAILRLAAGVARRIEVDDFQGSPAAQGKPVPGVLVVLADSSWVAGRTAESGRLDVTVPAAGIDLRLAAADGRRLDARLRAAQPEEMAAAVIALPPSLPASGRVVAEASGRPLPGALVWRDQDLGSLLRAGADGTFRFPHLAAETRVFAVAPGTFAAQAEVAGGRVPTLTLQPRLVVRGVVVDEAGKPVAGAALKAVPTPIFRSRRMPAAARFSGGFARSAPSGRFQLAGLAAGTVYDLRVQHEGFAPARVELPARLPGGAGAPDLRVVLLPGRIAFGTVLDGSRRPLAGAQVTLQATLPTDLLARAREGRDAARFPAVTDAGGRFEVKHVPAGSFDLAVRAKGFAPLMVPALAVPPGHGTTDLGTVVLAPGAAIRGVVTDAQGEPVADAEVLARGADRDGMSLVAGAGESPGVFTAADGSFVLADLAPGRTFDLAVTHTGYGPASAPGVAVPTPSPLRIVLRPTARVSGRVTAPDGKPVAGATLTLDEERRGFAGARGFSFQPTRKEGTADDLGGFSFADVSPGPFVLSAEAPHRQPAELRGLEAKAGEELKRVEIVLAAGATVEGRVLSPEGRPIADAEVSVAEASRGRSISFSTLRARADADGHYRIEGMSLGPHTLQAQAEGYRRAVRDVEAKEETRGVDFQLDRGLEVSGRVIDGAGSPVAGADVDLWGSGRDSRSTDTAADGAFRIGGLVDGHYTLHASRRGEDSGSGETEVTVAGAPVSGVELRLAAAEGAVAGRLTGLDLSQLSRVRVWVDSGFHLGSVDAEGNYRVVHLQPGTQTVRAIVPDTPLHAEGNVTVEPGATEARLDLHFGGGHALSGVVLRNGEPLAAAGVVLAGKGDSQHAATDHEGAFRFAGVDDGSYVLLVTTPNGARHTEKVEMAGDQTIRVELHTASLSGRVIDAADASPVAGAGIFLKGSDARPAYFPSATTDARGVFHLLEVGDGAWTVTASRDGYASAERKVEVGGDSPPGDVEILLDPTEGVTVEALLASGLPPDRLQVAALDGSGAAVVSGTYPSGENGRTRLANLPPGSWLLLVESDQSAPVTVPAAVPGPAVHVILPPAGQLHLQVPALANDPAPATAVLTGAGGVYRALDRRGVSSEWDLAAGERFLDRVPAGVWQVTARTADGRTWSGTAAVTPGGVAEVVLK
jgi:protocatechuate 3,4-dioxygenase beta subunit